MENSIGLSFSDGLHARFNLGISTGKNLSRKQPRILRPSDRDGRHGNPARHLDDRQQRVEPSEIFRRNRDTDDGKMRFGGKHSGKMSRAAGAGDNDFDTSRLGLLGIGKQSIRRPMRRDNHQFIGNSKFGEHGDRLLKNREVRLTSPKDSDERAGSFWSSLSRSAATNGTGHKKKSAGSFDVSDYRRDLTIAVFPLTVKITLDLSNSAFLRMN